VFPFRSPVTRLRGGKPVTGHWSPAFGEAIRSPLKACLRLFFCHFLLAQKVTKKGTTPDSYRGTNRLLDLSHKPAFRPAELAVRTFRGQPSRRKMKRMLQNKIRTNPPNP